MHPMNLDAVDVGNVLYLEKAYVLMQNIQV